MDNAIATGERTHTPHIVDTATPSCRIMARDAKDFKIVRMAPKTPALLLLMQNELSINANAITV